MADSSTLRRRGTVCTSTGTEYPNYLPTFRNASYEFEPVPVSPTTTTKKHKASSLHGSFLTEKECWTNDEQDVKTDVLYPRFQASRDDPVDMEAFQQMVQDHTRKLSTGTLKLSRTLSRQNQLYGQSKYGDLAPAGVRFNIYSTQKLATKLAVKLEKLLTEEGQRALEAVVASKGWWVDVLSPSEEEMRILSKTFRIHPLTTEDIQAQEPREKVELFPNYTFVCFRALDIDPVSDQFRPFNFYTLIFKEGLLTFHFKRSQHCNTVRDRSDQLKEYMLITPDWLNYALIDAVTDSFAPIILQVEIEAISIDELSLLLKKSEQGDMLRRISRCRKKSTQLARLLGSKLDVIKSLMKRYEDKTRELEQKQHTFPQQVNHALMTAHLNPTKVPTSMQSKVNTATNSPVYNVMSEKKTINDVLLYLGDIQDHVVTMLQNINHYDRILHRAHTNYLAQVNLELSQTYNMTNNVMNRLTFLATVFIPLTLVGGLWGMNVRVPGEAYGDKVYFFWILGGMALYCTACLVFGKRVGLL
ncbi:hypothetical protein EDC94DRAFT_624431 [Helicostylum pulchrum]|uniref:Cora-domain-containing protein n=1 Tax=Helicostylum pulchrum TaxID=562976 RepID=A0ABP9XXP0_9FUNG|nr:hypothetical protein EDC94DRAFT_624431 [Helicostylum pulchrum]